MHKELTSKQKFLNALAGFFTKYRVYLLVLLGLTVIAFVAVGIISEINKKRIKDSSDLLYENEMAMEEWQALTADDKQEKAGSLVESLNELSKKYKGTYAAQKALFMIGEAYYTLEDYEQAVEWYHKVAEDYSNGIFAPSAVFNMAAAYEQLDNSQLAAEYYQQLVDEYPLDSVYAPHALMNVGRLNSQPENKDAALAAYNMILEEYPSSDWTNLAITAIIHLDSD